MTPQSHLNLLESSGLIRLAATQPELEYLFRHALVQDAAYQSLLKQDRTQLHAAVGEALERLYPGQLDELAPTLAHHFERAGERDKAVRYLSRAGDRARAAYANQEAIAFYRAAVDQVEQLLHGPVARPDSLSGEAARLYEALGDLLALTGRHEEARDGYQQALAGAPETDRVGRARLYRKIGNTFSVRGNVEAIKSWDDAESALGAEPGGPSPAWWQEWVQIQLDRMWLHYAMYEVSRLAVLAEMAKPAVEQHGSPAQRFKFYFGLLLLAILRDHYDISDETLGYSRSGLAAAQASGDPSIVAAGHFGLGFSHLWRGELDEAEQHLLAGLGLGEQTGDVVIQSRCLTYLAVVYRKRGSVEQARLYASRTLEVAAAGRMGEYTACAKANLAWLAWRAGDLAEARQLARAAVEFWDGMPGPIGFGFRWFAVWPLLGVALAEGHIPEAVNQARELLAPKRQPPPEGLGDILKAAIRAEDQGRPEEARARLEHAARLAREMGYL